MILRAKYNMRYSEELARIISDHAQSDSFLEKNDKGSTGEVWLYNS